MKKYTSPSVKWSDVYNALPPLPRPLAWTWVVRPGKDARAHLMASVELVVAGPHGINCTLRRWGRAVSPTADTSVQSAMLLAAQEAHTFVKDLSDDDLRALAAWEMAARTF